MSYKRENIDRLTYLHEDILSHILSRLPTKLAVRTSILSKRWRYHWTLVYNLDFDDIHPGHGLNYFTNFVDRVLELRQTTQINLCRLLCFEHWVPKSSLSKWITEAIRLNVRELDIQVTRLESPLPFGVFNCKTLTKLRLVWGAHDWNFWKFPSSVKLPSLKILDIGVFSKPSINAFRLINGCPVLESLSLEVAYCDDDLHHNFNIPTLKRLELRTKKCAININKVVLNVPNLEYLFVGGELCSLFVMEDLSSLVEANVSVTIYDKLLSHLKADLLQGISGAKSLSWSTSTFDVPLNSPLPKFYNLKHLDLKGSSSSGWLSHFQFLESSSKLEHLCIEEPEEYCWIEPRIVPTCILSNLRTMKCTKCKGRRTCIQFLEYLLGNAKVMKTLTITRESLPMKEEMWLSAQLMKFPRASRCCEIHFVGNWPYYEGE